MEGPTLGQPWATFGLTATGKPKRKRVRSVMGCLTCRKRRVKCDEKRPRCSNCARHPLRICQYEYENEDEEKHLGDVESSVASMEDSSLDRSSFASSSKVTLDSLSPSHITVDQILSPLTQISLESRNYENLLKQRQVVHYMAAEFQSLALLNPLATSEMDLSNTFPMVKPQATTQNSFTALLTNPSALVRRCFASFFDHSHHRAGMMTPVVSPEGFLPMGSAQNRVKLSDPFRAYVTSVRENRDNLITGKLGVVAFALSLCEHLESPISTWREKLNVMIQRSVEKGGPGWIIGVSPPLTGYQGGQLENKEPLSTALYAELGAMLDIYACLTSGKIPISLSEHRQETKPWFLSSRGAQMQASPLIPDIIEVIFGFPRVLAPTFAHVTALIAKRSMMDSQDSTLKENLEFECTSAMMELEHVWPARLEARRDDRRLQFGGRIWRLGLMILLQHKVSMFSTTSPELGSLVIAFSQLCNEAIGEIGHLAGWIWPILFAACACRDHHQREIFIRLLPFAKGPVESGDNSQHAQRILTMIWFYQDIGDNSYHLREAVRDDTSLDLIIL
ncbi:uncharacterized protein IL334_006888 [Kwoniella shivajii]|uniref:Zn(2)-C6 fungal-type domain-containing protein n=1 Tax=Kwoniella shivajii TaxID=564305 RepID=A0ABZ1DB66_9TREE|nr:hypothetical protein IL334_006888 [Kwoniella shivajii]